MADITSINKAREIAFGGAGFSTSRVQEYKSNIQEFLNPEVNGQFCNTPAELFDSLGLKAAATNGSTKAASAQMRMLKGVGEVSAFSHYISNVSNEDFLRDIKEIKAITPPASLNEEQMENWIADAKGKWKKDFLETKTAQYQDFTESSLKGGTSFASAGRKIGAAGGFVAVFLKQFSDDNGEFQWTKMLNPIRVIGAVPKAFLGAAGGYIGGGIAGWVAGKAVNMGGGIVGKFIGEDKINKAKDFISGRDSNRNNLRSALESAMENATGASDIVVKKVKNSPEATSATTVESTIEKTAEVTTTATSKATQIDDPRYEIDTEAKIKGDSDKAKCEREIQMLKNYLNQKRVIKEGEQGAVNNALESAYAEYRKEYKADPSEIKALDGEEFKTLSVKEILALKLKYREVSGAINSNLTDYGKQKLVELENKMNIAVEEITQFSENHPAKEFDTKTVAQLTKKYADFAEYPESVKAGLVELQEAFNARGAAPDSILAKKLDNAMCALIAEKGCVKKQADGAVEKIADTIKGSDATEADISSNTTTTGMKNVKVEYITV